MGITSSSLDASVFLPINVPFFGSVVFTDASPHSASLGHSVIVLQFLLTVNLIVLISYTLGDDLVEGAEGTIVSYTSCILFTGCPDSFMSMTSLHIHLSHECFIRAVYHRIDFGWNFFKTLFSEVFFLEWVLRRYVVRYIGEESIIILGPILLSLFQKEARLYFGVRLTLSTLDTPPLLAIEVFSELR